MKKVNINLLRVGPITLITLITYTYNACLHQLQAVLAFAPRKQLLQGGLIHCRGGRVGRLAKYFLQR